MAADEEKPPKQRKWRNKFLTLIKRKAAKEDGDEDESSKTDGVDDESFDWWTKYYASIDVGTFYCMYFLF